MQIFCPSPDPAVSAAWLDDARVIKMVTETAQLLSAAVRHRELSRADQLGLYKTPPSGRELWVWAAELRQNFSWLQRHGAALAAECDYRGLCVGKLQKPREVVSILVDYANCPPEWEPREFVNRTTNQQHGLDFRHVADVHWAYKLYLEARWANEPKAKWTNRGKPHWACHF